MPYPWIWLLSALLGGGGLLYVLVGWDEGVSTLEGETMGTYWQVRVYGTEVQQQQIRVATEQTLAFLDAALSHWREDSEVSRLNRTPPREWLRVSESLWRLLYLSKGLAEYTDGAFDPTTGQLVSLWGFGPGAEVAQPPERSELETALLYVGADKLHLGERGARRMDHFQLDLSAIAKGQAVDAISDLLLSLGYSNHVVDIGGELKISGSRDGDEAPWRIAVAHPPLKPIGLKRKLQPTRAWGLATSGDYRNFFQWKGKRYSHLIDPKTGWPVDHDLASVSVAHSSAAAADALATALMVMGADKALKWAEENQTAVLLQQRVSSSDQAEAGSGENRWTLRASSRWRELFDTDAPLDSPPKSGNL